MTIDEAYSELKLTNAYNELRRNAAELRYIDQALVYLDTQEDPFPAQGVGRLEITLGTIRPFTVSIHVFGAWGPARERIEDHLLNLAANAHQWASAEVDTLALRAEPIVQLRSEQYEALIRELAQIDEEYQLNIDRSFRRLDDSLHNWYGRGKTSFTESFLEPLRTEIWSNQRYLAGAVGGGLALSREIARAAQRGLLNATTAARIALVDQLEARQRQDRGGVSAATALTVASGLVSIASLLTGKPTLWGITLTGLSLGLSGAAELAGGRAQPLEIQGASADEITDELARATGIIVRRADGLLQDLHTELLGVARLVDGFRNGHKIIPGRPSFTDGFGREDFRHGSSL